MTALFDFPTLVLIALAAVAGGIIGLDRTAAGQFMISQPIVAGPLVGLVLGDATPGLIIGAVLELIWVMDLPVGTFVPADSTIAAIAATATAVLGSRGGGAPLDLIGFSILLSSGTASITMVVDGIVRKRNAQLADAAVSAPGEDAGRRLNRAHLSGLAIFFLKSFVLVLVFVPAGLLAVLWFDRLPAAFHRAMTLFVKVLPLLGVASIVRKLSIKAADGFLLGGFLLAAAFALVFHLSALVIMLLTAVLGWLGVRYRARRS